jgi:hypothetical protein
MKHLGWAVAALALMAAPAVQAGLVPLRVTIWNPNPTPVNDLHLYFDKLVQPLPNVDGVPLQVLPGGPPFHYVSSGWSVDPAGGANASLNVNGLRLTNVVAAGQVALGSWCWSFNGSCDGLGKPYMIDESGAPQSLEDLARSGLFIVAEVPDVSSWALMVAGLGLLGATLRGQARRRKALA